MPKAAVNEDSQALQAKNEIWFARELRMPAPARDLSLAQKSQECAFSCSVSL
jgi:hypothetical protein